MNRQCIAVETLDTENTDPWQRLPGNEGLKRALEVALAGPHPMMILYYPEVLRPLKNLVQSLYETFDNMRIKTAPVCPCGYYQHSHRVCSCTPKEIRHHHKRLRLYDYQIIVESATPRVRDFLRPGESFADVKVRISDAVRLKEDKKTLCISSETLSFLETACTKVTIDPETAFQVADTIAALDQTTTICPRHMAEAIQYTKIPLL